jgi:capsular polysaccharide export protein
VLKLLFVALGEVEVPAYQALAARLSKSGAVSTRIVTLLPRLAQDNVECLESIARRTTRNASVADAVLAACGYAYRGAAADYDRDWYFASPEAKSRHVLRVFSALASVIDNFAPDLLISAVGGETTRMVAEALAVNRGIERAYFNSIPLPRRFVLLRSLAAPFIPAKNDLSTSWHPLAHNDVVGTGAIGQPPQRASMLDGVSRAWRRYVAQEQTYPSGWLSRKTGRLITNRVLSHLPAGGVAYDYAHQQRILYPLHDEEDFQVAVRERHALPQRALVRYLSSVLPWGYHLYLKPHPEHMASHHQLLWGEVAKLPNVHFLASDVKPAAAIEGADVVFTLASSMGLEALRAGKPVVCYGRPFYAGRGLTSDVDDPRELANALTAASNFTPPSAEVNNLVEEMMAWSWPGSFTPLETTAANLDLLASAVEDVLCT